MAEPVTLSDAVREWEAEEHRFLELEADYRTHAEFITHETRLHLDARFETARRMFRESKEYVALLLRGGDGA